MGARKRLVAEKRKEEKGRYFVAKLNNCPTSPRKMRLVADMIRGKQVDNALNMLKYSPKEAAGRLEKLVLSALSNWQEKNQGVRIEDSGLYVGEVFVDSARQLKRLRPAPQGRGHRIRKRSNHVTVVLNGINSGEEEKEEIIETNEHEVSGNTENQEPIINNEQ